MMPSAKDIINKTRGKDDATFYPTHNPNPNHFAGINMEEGKISLDQTHNPNPNHFEGIRTEEGKISLDQTHDKFELDLLKHNPNPNHFAGIKMEKGNASFDPTHNRNPNHFAGIKMEKSNASFDPTHNPNPNHFAGIKMEKGNASFDPTHNPNPNHFARIGKEKGNASFDPMNESNVGKMSFPLVNPFRLKPRIKTLKLIMSIETLAMVVGVISFGIVIFGSRFFAHLLSRFADDLDLSSSRYSKWNKVILIIMGVLGLTDHESELTLESLQVDDLQKLTLVSDPDFSNAIMISGVNFERAVQLRHAFTAFTAYY